MSEIKQREKVKGTIKAIDKGKIAVEKAKSNIVGIKEKSENSYGNTNENNANEYAVNRLSAGGKFAVYNSNKIKTKGNEAVRDTKNNFIKTKNTIKTIKSKLTEKKKIKEVKSKIKTSKKVVKDTAKVTKETVKTTDKARRLAVKTVKTTYNGIKAVFKATVSTVKGIIAGTKALISLLLAGGWIAVIIIIIICLIGLICTSWMGIFFSSESTGTVPMSSVVKEINKEMADKIVEIQNNNPHDDYKIESDRAEWKDVLAIYTAKITKGNNSADVITMDEKKKQELKKIFWDMNIISYEVKDENNDTSYEISLDNSQDKMTKKVLYIKITHKTIDEMMNMYFFNSMQKDQIKNSLSDEYASMWSSVIYGTPVGSPDMVQIALSQVGNVGGEPYWRWYGFNSRVEWCAVFVSWVANQSGYIQSGIIPKFSGCQTGIDWFKAMGEWQEKGYTPKAGDIIFFDWEVDGKVNHVGIVEKVENGKVYTVEGNSTDDTCRQKEYALNSKVIFGYGTPAY